MVQRSTPPELDDQTILRVTKEVLEHEQGKALSALVFDVLSRMAEGRQLFSGQAFAASRATEQGLDAEACRTASGVDVLRALERGPDNEIARLTLAAFFVRGLRDPLGG